jgi:tetratricopeptide (TPR) repeat protein
LTDLMRGRVETLAGDLEAAERAARAAAEPSPEIADMGFYVLAAIDLGRALCDQGRPLECLRVLDESERYPTWPDWEVLVNRPAVRALALARLGRLEEAETFAMEAVGQADGRQYLGFHADALVVLAEVLRLADRPTEATSALEEAIALYERKGNVVSAASTQALLAELR